MWEILEVYGRVDEDWLKEIENDYRTQRKASDI